MNRHLVTVFLYELRRNLRRKGFLFTTFGIPLLGFVLLFGSRVITDLNARNAENGDKPPAQEDETPFGNGIRRAGYVDLTAKFQDAGPNNLFLLRYADETAAKGALDRGEIDVYYIIPADYMETGKVRLILPRFSVTQTTDEPIRQLILSELSKGVDQQLFNRLLTPANIKEINLQRDASGQTASNFDADFIVIYLFAITLMISVFTTNGYLMQTVIEEKENRLIEILISSLRPTELLAGKILGLGVLGLIQIVVWLVAIFALGRLAAGDPSSPLAALGNISPEPGKLALLILYFIFGYLFFAAAYGMIGALSNSMQEGPQYAVIFTIPAVIPVYFLSLFISSPDGALPVALSLIPITAPLAMVMRISITTVPAWQIILSLVLLAVLDAGMIWVAGRLFRVQTLLAGHVPRLRDLPRLLRG